MRATKSLILHGHEEEPISPRRGRRRSATSKIKRSRETWCPGDLAESLRAFQLKEEMDNVYVEGVRVSNFFSPNPQPKKRQSCSAAIVEEITTTLEFTEAEKVTSSEIARLRQQLEQMMMEKEGLS